MSVLKRLRHAGVLFLILWGLQITWAASGAAIVDWIGRTALGGQGATLDDGHDLFRILELLSLHPGVGVAVASTVIVAAVVGWLAWTLSGGLVWGKLAGKSWIDAGALVPRTALPLLVQGLWHLFVMGAALGLLSIVLGPLPPMAMVVALSIAAGGCVVAHDLVRGQICLHTVQRPYHPMTAVVAVVRTFSNPSWLATGTALWLVQIACALGLNVLAVRGLGPSDPGPVIRLVAGGGLAIGLTRVAIVIGWLPVGLRHLKPDDEASSETTAAQNEADPDDGADDSDAAPAPDGENS